jgi:hypothetical protein
MTPAIGFVTCHCCLTAMFLCSNCMCEQDTFSQKRSVCVRLFTQLTLNIMVEWSAHLLHVQEAPVLFLSSDT